LDTALQKHTKTHRKKIRGGKKKKKREREKDYDYSDSGIKATRAPQAILRGEPDLGKKKKRETRDYHEADALFVLPSAYDEEEGKCRRLATRQHAGTHVQERKKLPAKR
jgi:hypothetical protein